ncbi:MAG: c-type cytochrome [Ferruginibacter sp.]
MKYRIILVFSILILLFGCGPFSDHPMGNGTAWASGSFNSNGKQIYFTGTSKSGTAISYKGGSTTGMMMSGNLACVSCHGTDATGGKHTMNMETMDAPDIRWATLSGGHHGKVDADSLKQHDEEVYTFESFKNSVMNGKHPDGDELKKEMPRWQMSDADLKDVMNYLKSLK